MLRAPSTPKEGTAPAWISRPWARYSIAIVAVSAGSLLRWLITAQVGEDLPTYVTFYPAVVATALLAGLGPGLFASALTVLVVDLLIVCPGQFFFQANPVEGVGAVLFLGMAVFLCLLTESYRRTRDRAAAYERELVLRESQKALQEREAQYGLALEAANLGTWDYNFKTGEVFWDKRCRDLFGVAEGDRIDYQKAIAIIREADRGEVGRAVQAALAPGSTGAYKKEYRVVWPDGSPRWVAAVGQVYFEGEGDQRKPHRFIGTVRDITESKLAEEALREREAQFRAIFDVASVGIVQADPNTGRQLRFNDKYCQITGYSAAELRDLTFSQLTHPGDRASDWELFARGVRGETPGYQNEKRYVRKDGTIIWVRLNAAFIRDATGHPINTVGVCEDITERRQAEAALRESRQDLNRAQAVAHAGSWRLNVRTNELSWSEETWRIFGIPQGTPLTYETFLSTVHPHDRNFVHTHWMAALRGEPYDIEHRIVVGGKVKWVRERAELEFSPDGPLLGGFGIAQDITERKVAEEQLQEREEQLRLVLEFSNDAIFWADADTGLIVRCNRKAEELTERNCDELVGLHQSQLHPLDRDYSEIFRQAAACPTAENIEAELLSKSGKRTPVLINSSVITIGGKRIMQGVFRDITARKRLEQELREQEQRWRQLAEAMPQLVWSCLPDGTCDFLSQQWLDYTGRGETEQLGYGWLEHVHPDDRNALTAVWQECVVTGEPLDIEFRIRRHDGVYHWFKSRSVPIRDPAGRIVKWYGSNTDIHDLHELQADLELKVRERTGRLRQIVERLRSEIRVRRAAEQRIAEAEFRYRTVADFTHDWEYWRAPNGALFYCSPSCERLTGWTAPELIAAPHLLDQMIHPEDQAAWKGHEREALTAHGPLKIQFRIQCKDGSLRWVEHVCTGVIDKAGEYLGVRASNRNITDRQRAEMEAQQLRAELSRVSRITTAGQLAAAIAHELNQPLGAILCNAQSAEKLLNLETPDLAETREPGR